jgi:hypothetical protein
MKFVGICRKSKTKIKEGGNEWKWATISLD